MNTRDAFADWDAAYVLGALSSTERRDFEDHLSACPDCRATVADLAGMPGLLAQVPPGEVLALDLPAEGGAADPMPMLAPEDGGDFAGSSRARRWQVPLAAAAAALAIGGIGGYAVSAASRPSSPSASASASTRPAVPSRLAFSSVRASAMTAVVDVVPAGATTELRVECQYAASAGVAGTGKGADYGLTSYAIWVVDRAGRPTELREWTARPGLVMHPTGVARLSLSSIATVEIRRVDDGQTVMRANLT